MRFNALLCLFCDGHRGRLLHGYIYSLYVVVFLIQVLFGQRGPTTLTASWLVCLFVCLPCSGPPYDLQFREVRDGSLVLLWAAPLYEGRGPVTGYVLEMSQGDQWEDWMAVREKTISDTRYKVSRALTEDHWFHWGGNTVTVFCF